MPDDRKTGRSSFVEDRRDLLFEDAAEGVVVPDPPADYGRGMDFQNGAPPGWGMLGNGPADDGSVPSDWAAHRGAGCCTCSDPAHVIKMNAVDTGVAVPNFTCKSVLGEYSVLSGYDPRSGANDTGLECRQVLDYRLKQGFADADGNRHKIGAYYRLPLGNADAWRKAIWLFPGVTLGFNVPDYLLEIPIGEPWRMSSSSPNYVGGHDVPVVGHHPDWVVIVTWGYRTPMQWELAVQTVEEAWCYLDPERYQTATGKTYNGYADVDLAAYITAVTNLGGVHNIGR